MKKQHEAIVAIGALVACIMVYILAMISSK